MGEDIRDEQELIHVSCSLCDELNGWFHDEKTAKDTIIRHLKKAHSNVYNPMDLSIERKLD